jgi:hypothetical protein
MNSLSLDWQNISVYAFKHHFTGKFLTCTVTKSYYIISFPFVSPSYFLILFHYINFCIKVYLLIYLCSKCYFLLFIGVVKKVGHIDREARDLWSIEIRATDSVHNVTVTLQISVLDFNDNTPYFLNSPYIFYENETTYNRTRIGALYANDSDSGQNADITFSISGGNSRSHFEINGSTVGFYFILVDKLPQFL